MPTLHGFCEFHKIGYNRSLDAHCPQCILGNVTSARQLDYEPGVAAPSVSAGHVLDPDTGAKLDAITLQPAK